MKEKILNTYPKTLLFLVFAIVVIGLVNLFSATGTYQQDEVSRYFLAQLSYNGLGILVMFVVSALPIKTLRYLAPVIYIFSLGLLVLVLIMGARIHGSLSWLDLGVVRLQPSEFAKIGLLFFLGRHLADLNQEESLDIKGLVKPVMIFLVPTTLVILQKDLGSSMFFGLIFFSLVMIQGVRWYLVVIGVALVMIVGFVSYHHFMEPYQKKRIVSFMNPELDPQRSGYHLVQSKIAVGSGKLTGMGYLKGASNKLKFLPERHTDFVFPVLAEEWGFIGGSFALLVYLGFLIAGLRVAAKTQTRFGYFLAVGVVSLFFWHLFVNLGGVLGLIPLTGVPLPFLSYGGSSLLTTWIAIGVLVAVHRSYYTLNY